MIWCCLFSLCPCWSATAASYGPLITLRCVSIGATNLGLMEHPGDAAPMQEPATLPVTSREFRQRVEAMPLRRYLNRLRGSGSRSSPAPPVTPRLGTDFDELPGLAEYPRRRAFTSASPTVIAQHNASDLVHAAWLCVEHDLKREFKWLYCVLDGVKLSCFRSEKPGARKVREHSLVAVQRLHCINRALLLTDSNNYRLWLHVGHEEAHLEHWLSLFREAIERQRRRRDGSLCLRRVPSSGATADPRGADVSFTGWLKVRRTFFGLRWLHLQAHRMYVVLSGRHLSAFNLDLEGRWADLCGQLVSISRREGSQWLDVRLRGITRGQRSVQLSARTQQTTAKWLRRMTQALETEVA